MSTTSRNENCFVTMFNDITISNVTYLSGIIKPCPHTHVDSEIYPNYTAFYNSPCHIWSDPQTLNM